MVCGRPPFRGATEYLTFKKVASGKVDFPNNMPEVAKDLISKLLVANPFERIGAQSYNDLKSHPFFESIDWSDLSHMEPLLEPLGYKLIWQEDVIREEEERQKQIRETERAEWGQFLLDAENIIVSGLIYKRRKLSIKKRFMILTDSPRIIYIDPKKKILKGEVPWSRKLAVEVKNDIVWRIHTVS